MNCNPFNKRGDSHLNGEDVLPRPMSWKKSLPKAPCILCTLHLRRIFTTSWDVTSSGRLSRTECLPHQSCDLLEPQDSTHYHFFGRTESGSLFKQGVTVKDRPAVPHLLDTVSLTQGPPEDDSVETQSHGSGHGSCTTPSSQISLSLVILGVHVKKRGNKEGEGRGGGQIKTQSRETDYKFIEINNSTVKRKLTNGYSTK